MRQMQQMDSTIMFSQDLTPVVRVWADALAKATAFIKKDMRIAASYRLQFIFQFLQVFFSVTVIYFIGEMISSSGGSSQIKGYNSDYFSFALVGLAVNSYLRTGLVTITNDIRQTMNQGTLEAMCATPISYMWLLLCSSLWQFIFETVRVTFYFVMAFMIFGMRLENANLSGAVVVLVLTAPVFLMLGIISCSILIVVKRGDPINWVFSSLGALLAGTMFPITVFPSWIRTIAYCLPLTHSLEGVRLCLLKGSDLTEVSTNVLSLLFFNILLLPTTIWINKVCMGRAKRQGAFSTH